MSRSFHATILTTLVSVLQVHNSLTFLLSETSCYTPSVCQCEQNILHCERRGLNYVPLADTNSDVYYAFSLSGNNISTIAKDSFQNYRFNKIDLSHNPIKTFDPDAFMGMDNDLLEVNLEDAHLSSIPRSVGSLSHLRTLNIKDNSAIRVLSSAVTMGIGKTLVSLSIGGTGIRYWPTSLSSLTNLQYLDMSHNRVSYLAAGATDAFAGTLRDLYLFNSSFASFQAPLGQLRTLQILDLSHNAIQSITKGSFSNFGRQLREFRLIGGKLSYLPDALEDLRVLEELDLSHNPMMSPNSDILASGTSPLLTGSHATLSTVRLINCSLVAVPLALQGLGNLITLDLSSNKIAILQSNQFSTMDKLSYLKLNDNPIKNIPYRSFAGLTSLSQLSLSGCKLSFVPSSSLHDMPNLLSLDMSSNEISLLLEFAFPSPSKLATVDLSGNPLKNISIDAFNGAHSIMTLKMNSCSLTSVPRALARANGLRAVYLENNAIECTCGSLSWVRQWRAGVGLIPRFYGSCSNDRSMLINDFVSEASLKQCPDNGLVG